MLSSSVLLIVAVRAAVVHTEIYETAERQAATMHLVQSEATEEEAAIEVEISATAGFRAGERQTTETGHVRSEAKEEAATEVLPAGPVPCALLCHHYDHQFDERADLPFLCSREESIYFDPDYSPINNGLLSPGHVTRCLFKRALDSAALNLLFDDGMIYHEGAAGGILRTADGSGYFPDGSLRSNVAFARYCAAYVTPDSPLPNVDAADYTTVCKLKVQLGELLLDFQHKQSKDYVRDSARYVGELEKCDETPFDKVKSVQDMIASLEETTRVEDYADRYTEHLKAMGGIYGDTIYPKGDETFCDAGDDVGCALTRFVDLLQQPIQPELEHRFHRAVFSSCPKNKIGRPFLQKVVQLVTPDADIVFSSDPLRKKFENLGGSASNFDEFKKAFPRVKEGLQATNSHGSREITIYYNEAESATESIFG